MELNNLIKKSHMVAVEHGWWEEPKSIGELLALIHSEVSEALEEHRNGYAPNKTYYSGKEKLEVETDSVTLINIVESPNKIDGDTSIISNFGKDNLNVNKPEGIPSELADVVIRVADMCGYYGIDLEKAIEEKMEYNETRSHKHGEKKL